MGSAWKRGYVPIFKYLVSFMTTWYTSRLKHFVFYISVLRLGMWVLHLVRHSLHVLRNLIAIGIMFAAFYSDFQTSRPFHNRKVNDYVSKTPHGLYPALDSITCCSHLKSIIFPSTSFSPTFLFPSAVWTYIIYILIYFLHVLLKSKAYFIWASSFSYWLTLHTKRNNICLLDRASSW